MTTVVITQPMLFPWVGMFEQMRLADVFVYYDDVAFSKGSFTNRVQIKTPAGSTWLTLPLQSHHLGQTIATVELNAAQPWRERHVALLRQTYTAAPFATDMLALVEGVYAQRESGFCDLVIESMEAVRRYFGLAPHATILRSSTDLTIPGKGSQRVLDMVRALGGTIYVTGHGARHYLDHAAFAAAGIQVAYLAYEKRPYAQLYGDFNPYVSILDVIANLGREGGAVIASSATDWKDFLQK